MLLNSRDYIRDQWGNMPFHTAIREGNLAQVRAYVEADPHFINTPVYKATQKNIIPPLHYALSCKQPEIVAYLMECECDISLQDSSGDTALHLLTYSSTYTRLEIWQPITDKIIEAFKNKNLLNVRNHDGESAVSLAIACDAVDSAKKLIDAGADLEQVNGEGRNAYPDTNKIQLDKETETYLKGLEEKNTLKPLSEREIERNKVFAKYLHQKEPDLQPIDLMYALIGKRVRRLEGPSRAVFSPRLFASKTDFMKYMKAAHRYAELPFRVNAIISLEKRHRACINCVIDTDKTIYALYLDSVPGEIDYLDKPITALRDAFYRTGVHIAMNCDKIQNDMHSCTIFSQFFSQKMSKLSNDYLINYVKRVRDLNNPDGYLRNTMSEVEFLELPVAMGLYPCMQSLEKWNGYLRVLRMRGESRELESTPINKRGESSVARVQRGTVNIYRSYRRIEECKQNRTIEQKQLNQGRWAQKASGLDDATLYQHMKDILGISDMENWHHNETDYQTKEVFDAMLLSWEHFNWEIEFPEQNTEHVDKRIRLE